MLSLFLSLVLVVDFFLRAFAAGLAGALSWL